MLQESLWSRLGLWMKRTVHGHDQIPLLAQMDIDLTPSDDQKEKPAASETKYDTKLASRRKGEPLDHPPHGYDQIVHLIETIQDHLVQQNHRSDRVVESLAELARGMNTLPEVGRQQADQLTQLAGQLEISNRHIQLTSGVLNDWPKAAMAQKEAMLSIANQLHASGAATDKLSGQLESLGELVKMQGESFSEQVRTLRTMQQAARQHESNLIRFLHSQGRRFAILFMIALVAVVAVGVVVSIGLGS